MYNLEDVRPSIERLVLAISSALNLEVAIFDNNSGLFFSTPTYLKKKGRIVHTPSITEVLNNGNVLVNTPGEMASCFGCRFKDHCPSTVEILCCIRAGTSVVGVADFTSFTKAGERRIKESTAVYLEAITELSTLISEYLINKNGSGSFVKIDNMIKGALEISKQPLILTDSHGVITQYNHLAAKVLKLCGAGASSLWQILPEDVVKTIINGNDLFEKNVSIGKFSARVTSKAIVNDGQIVAIFVRFSDEIYEQVEVPSFLNGIIGNSNKIGDIQRLVKKLASSPTPILITGETGTGKELVARALHEQSRRSKYPFVAINCSGIPESLFESELFGYEEGSFTGAKKGGKMGKIETAQGGTLFLDELGEMPLSVQPKLLRILQEYELERVGSTDKIHLDIRVIAATNCNLSKMIEQGNFREDLYYRIGVINMKLPPLCERKNDIMPISLNYIEKLKLKLETPLLYIDPEVEALFLSYAWPGNIRELQNVIEYAANLCESDTMTIQDLPEGIVKRTETAPPPVLTASAEERTLHELLEKYGCTLEGKRQIAKALGISLRTLYRKLNKITGYPEV